MIKLNILVKTVCGLPVFYVVGNNIVISKAYQTVESAERFLIKKLAEFGSSAVDQYHII